MKVTFQIEGGNPVIIECNQGDNLLELARRGNVAIDAPCSGNGSCGKCRVQLIEGELETIKSRHISDEEYADGWRLSCISKVLTDVTVYAEPGQKVAFVGATGAGKTTITNLINRFYEVGDGEITYDGIPIKEIKKDSLRGTMAMVLQDTKLFRGTIKDNIRYGKLDATDEEVIEAAKIANAHSFIEALPDGYETELREGGNNISTGQAQLINIARAAIAKAPLLILDEATSSVDTRTEILIQHAMANLMKGRTNFVIAHRLSTIKDADLIAVVNHGEIIERGNHQQLMEKKGFYYDLYTNQFDQNEAV